MSNQLSIFAHTCLCCTYGLPCMSTVTNLKNIWCLLGLWWDLLWIKGKWFPCNAAEGTLCEIVFSKHSLSLLKEVPLIRFSFYFCCIAHSVTAFSLLSLKENSKAGDSHSGRSGNTLIFEMYTHSLQAAKPVGELAGCDMGSFMPFWPYLISASGCV